MKYFEFGKQIIIKSILECICDIEEVEKSDLYTKEKELNEMSLNELLNEFGFYYDVVYNK